jgi:outer membrane protein assembly factor BamE (lipoprotein component of BamABCDE complex)
MAAAFLACLMALLTVDDCRTRSALRRAKDVKVGDTKQRVRNVLGRPSAITVAGIFDNSETWAYGGYVDWGDLLSCPIHIRIFGPDADEVAVRFNNSGRVSKIIMPEGRK